MLDETYHDDSEEPSVHEFLGLSPNLWRVAFVMGIAQFSVGLWKWQFGIFIETIIEPWQMGLVFSTGTFMGLLASFSTGTIADFIGRKRTLAFGFLPLIFGLVFMSALPVWPFLVAQFGLVWFGMSTTRIMNGAIPADEIAKDAGRSPAKRFMMIMVPLWFVDGISPLIGTFLLNSGYTPSDLHRIASIAGLIAFFAALVIIRETLDSRIIEKAKAGPVISFRNLGSGFWKIFAGMASFSFFWAASIQYLGNLSVDDWGVDVTTYGYTWSAFSLTSAILMYGASWLTDKNLKAALVAAVFTNGLVFLAFGYGSGVLLLYLVNIIWAIPFIIWIGAEKSLVLANVPEETKGRAFGTYSFLRSSIAIFAAMFGAVIWEITDSLRAIYLISGFGMVCTALLLIPILRSIKD